MSILRDPAESALNDVVRLARNDTELYEDAADRVDDERVRELFRASAEDRRHLADRLTRVLDRMDELPESPDGDPQDLHLLWNAVRSFFAEEHNAALLADRERAETELAHAVEAALGEGVPSEARRILETTRRRIESVREELRRRREALR